jgi:hypothetical protein
MGAESIRLMRPLFQAVEGGETPTSALQLWFSTIDFAHAKALNKLWHSRFPEFGGGGYRRCHTAEFSGRLYAVAIWTNPTSPKLPQLEWLMLKRWAIADDAPPNTASRMMRWMKSDIRRRLPEVTTLVSYSDPDTHHGGIYRACGWTDDTTTQRNSSSNAWHNRKRNGKADNELCKRVTRWLMMVSP